MQARLCLVSTPGRICDATCAIIAAMPDVRLVAMAAGALTATNLLQQFQRDGAEVDVILLDANLAEDEVLAFLAWLADHRYGLCAVVARATSFECHQARAFGAAAAMRRDELPLALKTFIASLCT